MLAGLTTVVTAPAAHADVQEALGHEIRPGQPFEGDPGNRDWVGSYTVDGKQVFCVQFAYKAPDSNEQYEPGDELLNKWGEPLDPEQASYISYLLLRYGDTQQPDEAAAVAHLLHSWTSGPRSEADLDPSNDFRSIGYDIDLHHDRLPASAQQAIERLRTEAENNHGPWTAEVTAPEEPQLVDEPDDWSVSVRNAKETGMSEVPVTLELTDATLVDGSTTGSVVTSEDGAATTEVIPTGPEPKVVATLDSPADVPRVQEPVAVDTQRIVSTGGEKQLSAEASTEARTKPGKVAVSKVDTDTGDPIAAATLQLTGEDKTEPALGQDGEPLTGPDDKPVVLSTDEQGKAEVQDIQTPQQICVVEVNAPKGYEDAFDPKAPPSACGEVKPGETLTLEVANAPNKPVVPEVIPAGDNPQAVAKSDTLSNPSAGALVGLAALLLLAGSLGGLLWRKRSTSRR